MTPLLIRRAGLAALAGLGLLGAAPAVQADPGGWPVPPPPGPATLYDTPWPAAPGPLPRGLAQIPPEAAPDRFGGSAARPGQPQWTDAQDIRRCNIGRVVGGLFGGAVGYGVSRGDGRSWVVPLGALLGQQMGCNLANSRTPLPW